MVIANGIERYAGADEGNASATEYRLKGNEKTQYTGAGGRLYFTKMLKL